METPSGRPKRDTRRTIRRRRLFTSTPERSPAGSRDPWSDEENKALVKFVLLYYNGDGWPSYKKASMFWKDASEYVKQQSNATQKRTGENICMLDNETICVT